ncbi:hypothetical protein [Streptomyces noursei]|uniref:hypothetical protein n=1 Tax=Streptomyces noursei TaxID=1971 RepID=UPI0023B80604|nr:hypothetical protein [Streptomyces noursei]
MMRLAGKARYAAGAAALALAALAAPGAGSATAAGQGARYGKYCSPWKEWYGNQGWVFTDLRLCLDFVERAQTDKVWAETQRTTWRGRIGDWHSASINNQADGFIYVRVSKGGKEISRMNSGWIQKSREHRHWWNRTLAGCGTYTLKYQYTQHGPGWDDEQWKIDTGWRTLRIDVPCR